MQKQRQRLSAIFPLCVFLWSSAAIAADKRRKVVPSPPRDAIEVVGHIPSTGVPVTRFVSPQHYSSYYLYVEHEGGANVTLIDVTRTGQPAVLSDVAYSPSTGGNSESLLTVAGTAALVNSDSAAATP